MWRITAMGKASLRVRPSILGVHYRGVRSFSKHYANPEGALDTLSDGENCCSLRDGSHGALSRWHFHSVMVRGRNAWSCAREHDQGLPHSLILTLNTLGIWYPACGPFKKRGSKWRVTSTCIKEIFPLLKLAEKPLFSVVSNSNGSLLFVVTVCSESNHQGQLILAPVLSLSLGSNLQLKVILDNIIKYISF